MRISVLIMLFVGGVASASAGGTPLRTVQFDELGQYWELTVADSPTVSEAAQRLINGLEPGETAHATITFVIDQSGDAGEWEVDEASHDGLLVPLLKARISSSSMRPASGLDEPVPVRVVMRDVFERY